MVLEYWWMEDEPLPSVRNAVKLIIVWMFHSLIVKFINEAWVRTLCNKKVKACKRYLMRCNCGIKYFSKRSLILFFHRLTLTLLKDSERLSGKSSQQMSFTVFLTVNRLPFCRTAQNEINMISHSQIFLLLLHNFYHSFLWKPLARFLLALLGHSSNIFISVISRPDRYTVQNLPLGIRGFAVPNEVNLTYAASNLGGCPVL